MVEGACRRTALPLCCRAAGAVRRSAVLLPQLGGIAGLGLAKVRAVRGQARDGYDVTQRPHLHLQQRAASPGRGRLRTRVRVHTGHVVPLVLAAMPVLLGGQLVLVLEVKLKLTLIPTSRQRQSAQAVSASLSVAARRSSPAGHCKEVQWTILLGIPAHLRVGPVDNGSLTALCLRVKVQRITPPTR